MSFTLMFPRPSRGREIIQYMCDELTKGVFSHLYLSQVVPFNDPVWTLSGKSLTLGRSKLGDNELERVKA